MTPRIAPRELPEEVLLGPLFDALPVGVVVLDAEGRIRAFNQHEEKLANRKRERVLGKEFFREVAPCMNVRELAGEFERGVRAGTLDARVEFNFPFPHLEHPRDVLVRMLSVRIRDEPHGLLIVEDVSMRRAVERMKDSLAKLLVHDFANPISITRSNLEFMRDVVVDRPEVLEAAASGIDALDRLGGMVFNLLDITRLETGTFSIRPREVDVGQLVRAVVRGNEARAERVGIVLSANAPEALLARLDESAIRRALFNLIENALQHTPRGGRVMVTAAENADEIVFRVSDTGPGMPSELWQKLFAPESPRKDFRGLGLAFVRLAVVAHGGELRLLDSERGGAVLEIRMPRVV